MTDDELNRLADESFVELDRRETHDNRKLLLKQWAFSVFCWDGALPIAVIAIPKCISLLFANRQGIMELTFLIVPIVAFLIRYAHGVSRRRNQHMYFWQFLIFLVAIVLLVAIDAMLIMAVIVQNPPPVDYWLVLLAVYGIYLVTMAIAMYPARALAASRQPPPEAYYST